MGFLRKRRQIRLRTDHHHLLLEILKNGVWELCGERHFEYVSTEDLIAWLQPFLPLRNADFSLVLSDDFCELKSMKAGDPSAYLLVENHFIDVHEEGDHLIVVSLEAVKVEAYLSALKASHLKLRRIIPWGFPHLNLLPWRQAKARQVKMRRRFYLWALPLSVMLVGIGITTLQESKINQAQNQNQVLTRQFSMLVVLHPPLKLANGLPLIEEGMKENEIEMLSIDRVGSVHLRGSAHSVNALNTLLAKLPNLAPKSMHDLVIESGQGNQAWSADFELEGAGS